MPDLGDVKGPEERENRTGELVKQRSGDKDIRAAVY